MKQQTFLGGIALTFMALTAAVPAGAARDSSLLSGIAFGPGTQAEIEQDGSFDIARRGRGRGGNGSGHSGGNDDDHRGRGHGANDGHRSVGHGAGNGHVSGSGRSKPRIPGGSGCDDPGDILEHAECRP